MERCGVLWCFYQLFGLWFWRHPFTAEDPLVSKWWNAKFLQICSDEETNSSTSWMAWGWIHYQQIVIFGQTIPLKTTCLSCRTRYWRPVSLARSRLLWSYLWQEGLWNAKLIQMYYLQLQYRCNFPCLYTDVLVFSSVGFFTPLMRHLSSIPTTPLSPGSLCPTQTWSSTRGPWSAPYDPERWGLTHLHTQIVGTNCQSKVRIMYSRGKTTSFCAGAVFSRSLVACNSKSGHQRLHFNFSGVKTDVVDTHRVHLTWRTEQGFVVQRTKSEEFDSVWAKQKVKPFVH